METGISRARLALVGLTLALAGCGGASHPNPFSRLHPQAPPASWRVVTIPNGASMAYPPGWRPQHGDPGTATVTLKSADGSFLGYLNLTPREGAESLANWSSFRVDHNGDEGDIDIKRLAAATGLRFRSGRGSCVKDSYATRVGAHYVEIACLVVGTRSAAVIVGAAPPERWSREAGALERAIEAVRT
jgi:hypothetical protein